MPLARLYKNQFRACLLPQASVMKGFLFCPKVDFVLNKVKQPLKLVSTPLIVQLS